MKMEDLLLNQTGSYQTDANVGLESMLNPNETGKL
jgi:hypothetical protein